MNPPGLPISPTLNLARATAGAFAGAVTGYLAFGWLVSQGFYALALPGVLLGLGGSMASKQPSRVLAIVCGLSAAALGLFTEWSQFPFTADKSFGYFLAHLADLRPLTWIMLAVGSAAAAWFVGRGNPPQRTEEKTPA